MGLVSWELSIEAIWNQLLGRCELRSWDQSLGSCQSRPDGTCNLGVVSSGHGHI